MSSVSDAIRRAAEQLSATSDTARLDAELLMTHALEVSRSDLLLRHMDADEPAEFQPLIDRRAGHEPVAYIAGAAEFYGREFAVRPGVLIPRSDSEVLIHAALEIAPPDACVLDLGSGSGALMLTFLAERPAAQGVGVDASPDAVDIGGSNAMQLESAGEIAFETAWRFFCRDWNTPGWSDDLGTFDLILCNPPYVETDANLEPDVRDFEPAEALFAGADGMDDYSIIIPQVGNLLKAGGAAILEIGHRQGEMIQDLAKEHGFSCELRQDLAGRDRCCILRSNG